MLFDMNSENMCSIILYQLPENVFCNMKAENSMQYCLV